MFKTCSTCHIVKSITEFSLRTDSRDGHTNRCKACIRARRNEYAKTHPIEAEKAKMKIKKWREANKELLRLKDKEKYQLNRNKIIERSVAWGKSHPERLKEIRQGVKERRKEKDKAWRREYRRKQRQKPAINLADRMKMALRQALGARKHGRKWETIVGYTKEELMAHLLKTMPKGYDWQDLIEGRLHIDHKIPCAVFHYVSENDIDFKRCWALNNLQLLPARENVLKRDKLDKPFQPALRIAI